MYNIICNTRILPYHQDLTSAQWRRCCSYGWILWIVIRRQVSTYVMKYLTTKTQTDSHDCQGTIKIHINSSNTKLNKAKELYWRFAAPRFCLAQNWGANQESLPIWSSQRLENRSIECYVITSYFFTPTFLWTNSKSLHGACFMQRTTNMIEFHSINNNTMSTIQTMPWLLKVTNKNAFQWDAYRPLSDETPLDRDPPRQRPPQTETPLGQRLNHPPPPPRTEKHLRKYNRAVFAGGNN